MKVHFIGIGGSGMSGVAEIARHKGFEISGCDLKTDTPYINKLKEDRVEIFDGQDISHIKDVDLVAVTPAVLFQNNNHPEIEEARKENKLITWQEFLGKYLQKEKEVICIAGTHGKSTTTAMVSLLFEKANLDPSVMIGANVSEWNANFRVGNSDIFITEADEFYDNFLSYAPQVIVLNNIEFDHPDYFKNESQVYESFRKFVKKLHGQKVLIYNQDDKGIKKLFGVIGEKELSKINLIGYTTKDKKIKLLENETEFQVDGVKYELKIPGEYNVSNALGVIALAQVYDISTKVVKDVLKNFNGIGRRLELIGEKSGIKVYDDYAHHPTAIKKTLKALRQKYPNKIILAIVEPHTYSRTKALLPLYKDAFEDVDEVLITPIYKSRDTQNFGVSGKDIVKVADHKNIAYVDNFERIVKYVAKMKYSFNVIVVMGAGDSYKLAKEILNSL